MGMTDLYITMYIEWVNPMNVKLGKSIAVVYTLCTY